MLSLAHEYVACWVSYDKNFKEFKIKLSDEIATTFLTAINVLL